MKILIKVCISHIFLPIWNMQILYGPVSMQWNWKEFIWKKTCIVFNKDRQTHLKCFFENLNSLNVYQINTYRHLNIMHKFIKYQISLIFSDLTEKTFHKYPANFSRLSFSLKRYYLNGTKCFISILGPKLWNDFIKAMIKLFCI